MSRHSTAFITLTFLPAGSQLRVLPGTTILEAAFDLGLELTTLCGGAGLCGQCRIILRQGELPITSNDREHLSAQELNRGFRLACSAVPAADCTVEIPPAAAEAAGEILTEGTGRAVPVDPAVRRIALRLDPPRLESGMSDLEIVMTALPAGAGLPPLRVLQRLSGLLRQADWRGDAILLNGRLIDFQPAPRPLCGLAVDLGTTTVVAKLFDLESGRLLATASGLNCQRRHGEDVIARIAYANAHGVSVLQQEIIGQLSEMTGTLTAEAGIVREDIYEMVVAGNTVMEHLLLGLPPRHLAEMPYVPAARMFAPVAAAEIGLELHPAADVVLLPVLGKFVGGDTAAVLLTLAGRLDESWLAVDIGTNGEILLCRRGRIWTTSTAAGPAFEGAQISAGMRAAAGAIERVWWRGETGRGAGGAAGSGSGAPGLQAASGAAGSGSSAPRLQDAGRLEVRVIGGGEAQGICGSGIIDAVAALLEAGALDASGRLVAEHPLVAVSAQPGVPDIQSPVNTSGGPFPSGHHRSDQPAVRLTDGILLTQRDIREVQLAKSAIATAIALLLQSAALQPDELQHIYLAGAFGQYISPQAALRIGLLPPVGLEKIKFIGNAACEGAEMALVNGAERQTIVDLLPDISYVEVAADPQFQERFAENLLFQA